MGQLVLFAIPTNSLMISILSTGANTSLKSMHCLYKNPFATNPELCLIVSPTVMLLLMEDKPIRLKPL